MFSAHFAFNDAEERGVNSREDVSLIPCCSGFWQQAGCCLQLGQAGRNAVADFVVFTDNLLPHSIKSGWKGKMCPKAFLKSLGKSHLGPSKCLLLHGHTQCPRGAWTWRALIRGACRHLELQYPVGDVHLGNTAHEAWSRLKVLQFPAATERVAEAGGTSGDHLVQLWQGQLLPEETQLLLFSPTDWKAGSRSPKEVLFCC